MADHQPLAAVPEGAGLTIVLFGVPGAGKSALLSALWQASQSQTDALGGKLSDPSGALNELQQRLYQKKNDSAGEVMAYPVTFEPTGDAAPTDVILVDCDGRVAQEFLTQNQHLENGRGTLARAILHADALVVPLDPSAGGQQLEKELQLLLKFVQTLEQLRSKRNEVAGLPVYFVLTKCDLFAKPAVAASAWVAGIDDAKRKIAKRIQEYLAKIPRRDALAFGKVDVHMWATAVKQPQLADRPAKSEPLGVAELFRQCFRAARTFHEHRRQAQGWLQTVVMSFLGLVALMGLVAAFFYLTRPSAERTALENKIQMALPGQAQDEHARAEWFRGNLDDRLKALREIRDNPDFENLPAELQGRVNDAQQEIETYQKLNEQFSKNVPLPRFAKDSDDLEKIEKAVTDLGIPPAYAKDWAQTSLIKRQQKLLSEVNALRTAVSSEVAWLKEQMKEGDKLIDEGKKKIVPGLASAMEREAWLQHVQDFLTRPPRNRETDPVPSAPTITYATVYRFRALEKTQQQVKSVKDTLVKVRNLAQ